MYFKQIGAFLETNPTVGPVFTKIMADPDLIAIAVAIYQNGPARLTGKTIEDLMQEAVLKINAFDVSGLELRSGSRNALVADLGAGVAQNLVHRYNFQDNNKKFNMMDIIQKIMAVAQQDLTTYFADKMGFEAYDFTTGQFNTVEANTRMANFFTQKISMALETTIPQIGALHFRRKDVTRVVAIYNHSPIANGFGGIPGTGTVEHMIRTLMGQITNIFHNLPGTNQVLPGTNGQTLADLAVSVSDQIGTNFATRYNLQDQCLKSTGRTVPRKFRK